MVDGQWLVGQWVRVHGLQSRPELNGLTGKVHSFDDAKGRQGSTVEVFSLAAAHAAAHGSKSAPACSGPPLSGPERGGLAAWLP